MLNADAAQLLQNLAASGAPALHELSAAEAREQYTALTVACDMPALPMETTDFTIPSGGGSLKLRLYTPAGTEDRPVVLFFHGGGWVIGGLSTHEGFCTSLASQLAMRVLFVEYRLAPEHPFPAAFADCLAAARWAAAGPDELGGEPLSGLGLAGDSAGGNLAAAIGVALGDTRIRAQLLLYPALDMTGETGSLRAFAEGHFLDAALMAWFTRQYARDDQLADPRVSPLHHPDMENCPPTALLTCEYDPLRDEGRAFAASLARAGRTIRFSEARGLIHGICTLRAAIPSAVQPLAETIADFRGLMVRETQTQQPAQRIS